ncbi:MAG: hypothetical protein K9J12_18085 [Melioribacteraceae bacterium]|nr:hypothetical protein [Melioribacteraceae bacterium]
MKNKIGKLIVLAILFMIVGSEIVAQRIVKVSPGFGTLNSIIENDYNANSLETLNNTIYELERDGFYVTNGTIENVGYELNVWAEVGAGARPIIKCGVDQGGLSVNSFSPRGDLHIKGLNIVNVDVLGNVLTDAIIGRSDSLNIIIDDCHLDSASVSFIRMDVDWLNIKVINSIISNAMGNYHNSRFYDTRKNNVDSILVQNCTFYNIGGYPSRGTSSGGAINYIKWDHNTLYNVGRKIGGVGQTIDSYFTNNLIINTAILGRDSLKQFFSHGQFENDIFLTIRELNNLYAIGKTQKMYFHHNNFFVDDEYKNYNFPAGIEYPIPYFEPYGWKRFNESNTMDTWFEERIAFTNPPPVDVSYIHKLWTDTDENQNGQVGDEILAIFSNEGRPFDFSYSESNFCYTAAEDGFPLGDLNWFPDKKADWENGLTSVDDKVTQLPLQIELHQNYPNPFNPSTIISYQLNKSAGVNLTVHDILGNKIISLVDGKTQSAGIHKIEWNGKNSKGQRISSNILFARLEVNGEVFTNKMIMVK